MNLKKSVNIQTILNLEKTINENHGIKGKYKKNNGESIVYFLINFYKNKNDSASLTRKKIQQYTDFSNSHINQILINLKFMKLIKIEENYRNGKALECIITVGKNIFSGQEHNENTVEITHDQIVKHGKKIFAVIKADYMKLLFNGQKVYINRTKLKKDIGLNNSDLKYLTTFTDLHIDKHKIFNIRNYTKWLLFNNDLNLSKHKNLYIKAPLLLSFKDDKLMFKWFNVNSVTLDNLLSIIISKNIPSKISSVRKIKVVENVKKCVGVTATIFERLQESLYITNIFNKKHLFNKVENFVSQTYPSNLLYHKTDDFSKIQNNMPRWFKEHLSYS